MSVATGQDKLRAWLSLLNNAMGLKKDIDKKLSTNFGMSLSRFDVLSALQRGGVDGLKAGALTKMLVVSDGNTTQVTDKLVRDGLVTRTKSAKDGRVVIYSLTADGAEVFKEMAANNKQWVSDAFAAFSQQELTQLKTLLSKLDINPTNEQDAS